MCACAVKTFLIFYDQPRLNLAPPWHTKLAPPVEMYVTRFPWHPITSFPFSHRTGFVFIWQVLQRNIIIFIPDDFQIASNGDDRSVNHLFVSVGSSNRGTQGVRRCLFVHPPRRAAPSSKVSDLQMTVKMETAAKVNTQIITILYFQTTYIRWKPLPSNQRDYFTFDHK